jgi:hypothetical protein
MQTRASHGNERSGDGKEGVRGSSPREGFASSLLRSVKPAQKLMTVPTAG